MEWTGEHGPYTHTIACCEQPEGDGRFVLCCRWIPLCPSFSEMSAAPLIRKIGNMRGELKRLAVRDCKGSGGELVAKLSIQRKSRNTAPGDVWGSFQLSSPLTM